MCKVLAFTNSSNLKIKDIAEIAGNALLKSEKDGFGYAVQGATNVYGEKCIAPTFQSRFNVSGRIERLEPKLPIKAKYSRFGKFEPGQGPAIFHGRTSTNVKGLTNCHPMQRDDWHLIHNGVVTDHGETYAKKTQNDSEDVLFRLIQGIDQVEAHLTGYYAFAAIDSVGRLHVGKDAVAPLHVAWSKDLDSYIIATTETLIKDVAKGLKVHIGPIDEIGDNTYLIFIKNDLYHSQSIKPRGWSSVESQHSDKSLGRSLYSRGDGEIVDMTSESGWPTWGDSDVNEERESAYYAYLKEIDHMDASYDIYDADGKPMQLYDFYKLDPIAREQCTIVRPDGTVLDLSDFETKLYTPRGA